MTNYDDGYDGVDDDRKKDGQNYDNAASRSLSCGPFFDPITTPWSQRSRSRNDSDASAAVEQYISMCQTIYLPYKYSTKDTPQLLEEKLEFWDVVAVT